LIEIHSNLLQSIQETYGQSMELQEQILDMQLAQQKRLTAQILDEKHGLNEALLALDIIYGNKKFGIFLNEQQRERDFILQSMQARSAIIEANRNIQGELNNFQVEMLKKLHDDETKQQNDILQAQIDNIQTRTAVDIAQITYLHDQQKLNDANNAQYKRTLDEQTHQQQLARERKMESVRMQLQGLPPEVIQERLQERDIENQTNEIAKELNLSNEKLVQLIQEQTDRLRRQFELQKEQQRIAQGRRAGELSGAGQAQALDQLANAAGIARTNLEKVRAEYEANKASLQELIDATDAYNNSLQSMNDILTLLLSGKKIDLFSALKVAFQEVAQAAEAAFEAIGSGQSAGKAMEQMVSSSLKAIAQYSAGQFALQMALGIGALFPPYPNAPAAGHFISAAKWAALMAGAGIAAGATSGAGGGTGPSQAGTGGPQPLAPVQTRTAMEDQLIKLNQNLVVQGRVLQYAGTQLTNFGANVFALEHDINMMAVSNRQGWRDVSQNLLHQLDTYVQHGFTAGFSGIASELQFTMRNYSNTLPQVFSNTLSGALKSVSTTLGTQNEQLITLSKAQLIELQKANDKNWSPIVQTAVSIDGPGFQQAVDDTFLHSATTVRGATAISNASRSAASSNINRQSMGTTLSNRGGV
jgi:hypothetical protein